MDNNKNWRLIVLSNQYVSAGSRSFFNGIESQNISFSFSKQRKKESNFNFRSPKAKMTESDPKATERLECKSFQELQDYDLQQCYFQSYSCRHNWRNVILTFRITLPVFCHQNYSPPSTCNCLTQRFQLKGYTSLCDVHMGSLRDNKTHKLIQFHRGGLLFFHSIKLFSAQD